MSDIPDYIYELLGNETDLSTRRNAFAFLMDCKQPLAIEFLENNCDEVALPLVCDCRSATSAIASSSSLWS